MNVLGKLCLTGLAALLSAGAQAAIITYQYTATVSLITEYDYASDTYTDLLESNFTGNQVMIGDVLRGIVRYDTAAVKSTYQPPDRGGKQTTFYNAGPQDAITYRFDATGLAYQSDPSRGGQTSVGNAPPMSGMVDHFSKSSSFADSDYIYNGDILLGNTDGTAFQDTSLPSLLDPALFQELLVGGAIYRRANLDAFYFEANITSFTLLPADVPEPGALLLFAAGAGSLVAARRRARRTNAG